MALKDKRSIFDRNFKGVEGPIVGKTFPQDGSFFTDEGKLTSPFGVDMGPKSDQMVELLNNPIVTATGNTYNPAPNNSDFQDLPMDITSGTPSKYEDNFPS